MSFDLNTGDNVNKTKKTTDDTTSIKLNVPHQKQTKVCLKYYYINVLTIDTYISLTIKQINVYVLYNCWCKHMFLSFIFNTN